MAVSQLQFNSWGIPANFDLFYVYNPKNKYDTSTLSRTPSRPSRPPSSFALLKNCLRLEFESQFPQQKLKMPNLCRYAKEIWKTIPKEVKSIYVNIAEEAEFIHNEMYPNCNFKPYKRKLFPNLTPSLSMISDSILLSASYIPYKPSMSIIPSIQDIYCPLEESIIIPSLEESPNILSPEELSILYSKIESSTNPNNFNYLLIA
ncbi:26773_t:CDS:2 [Dentiscutata erythropus]|uniref:26773_t:CDS:1 n=1 Tax=Dentiscutata erythropus TaxID=1348616 RepID=A0A9N9HZR4_9GLOM|nr:26773_t:CDS:2 [Dentiscutata erythropus]